MFGRSSQPAHLRMSGIDSFLPAAASRIRDMSSSIDRRDFLASLPALAMAPRLLAQAPAKPTFRVNGLSQITLTVSDVKRSVEFYQGLFGMPVQARQGAD